VLDTAPTNVQASSDGGDVEIALPDTPDAYRVQLSSDGGETSGPIRTDPTSSRVITASSNGGNVDRPLPDQLEEGLERTSG
jgi:hypothetical protein